MQSFIARPRAPTARLRLTLLPAAVLAGALGASQACAQASASASATASISIGNALAVTRTTDLSFGRIVVNDPATPASVTVGTASSVTGISNATEESGTGAGVGSATFVVSGVGGQTYSVTFPQVSINLGAGANPPTVDSFASTPSGAGGQLSGVSTGIGTQNLAVGGMLHVPANTAPGAYTGSFQVNVAYN